MADECVVCGEAEEGKPLYKKLGSGEFNVEVITALKALQMVSIPEAAKNSSYICWDCDELIVEQYDRYLREQQVAAVVQKQTKKQQQNKKKKKPKPSKIKLKISKDNKRESSWGIAKPQPQKQTTKKPGSVTSSATSSVTSTLSKTKQLEQRRATNAYHSSHCLMCDNNFETERRTYQRFSLKNRVNDEMDIAQVMEVLGLARHIAPDMKARRFVCNPCFFIIRRNYKDKLMKEATEEARHLPLPSTPTSLGPQRSIHRATTEEHAAEIAKLLPPGLAECYKIVTENPVNKKQEPVATSQKDFADENTCLADGEEQDSDEGEEEEEEEGALKVSQDEHGNYFIDIHDKGCEEGSKVLTDREEQPAILQTSRRKKNVLLPRRMHKHLSLSPLGTPERHSDTVSGEENGDEKEEEEQKKTPSSSSTTPQELWSSRRCNICGITIAGKPSTWWHTLTSPLDGFESINVTTALKLLETCLTSRNQKVQEDQSVCLPCYSKVSTGFKSQVIQRIARHRDMDVSEVNLSRVKVRMLPKEALEPSEVLGLEGRVAEAAESADVPRSSERSTGTSTTQPMSEESGEGEKENMDIEKHGHKRKLNEVNVLSDKKRKLYRSGVDMTVMSAIDSSEAEASQDCSSVDKPTFVPSKTGNGNACKRAKNGRFVKRKTSVSRIKTAIIKEEPQHTESVVTDGQEEKAHTSHSSQEIPRKQNKENKETEPLVVLKDLKFVLPQEAFSGKRVSSHKIESIMEPPTQLSPDQPVASHSDLSTTTSPLQLVFNALSTYHLPAGDTRQAAPAASIPEHPAGPQVCGCCVVCGCSYTVPLSSWHSVEEDIRPPTLLVPVRWVCISLAICLPQVSVEDAHLARVCKHCFERLGDHFEVFVKRKVGESCGLEAEAVDLSEYLFTFNTETMNLEADPKQQSYIHEFEDVGQLLQRIQLLVEQFSVDEVVGEGKRQPVLEQHFCVWLLLVLNELRMQVGAAIGDLARWLVALMPVDMYESSLRPCPNNLASFLLNTTRCSKDLTEDVLEGPIPAWVFVADDTFQATEAGKVGTAQDNENEDEDLCWEDFLHHVNLDALVGGKATPVSAVHFTQGLVYAVWRTSQLLGEGEHQVMDWLRQLSPLPLSKEQLENLVTMIGQLHNHLEEHPEDIHELECAIIPQLQNEHCAAQSSSDSEKVNMPLSDEAQNSCVLEEDRSSAQAYNSCVSKEDRSIVQDYSNCEAKKDRSSVHVYKSPESKNGKSKAHSIKKIPRMKNRKESPTLKTLTHKKNKRFKSFEPNMKAREQKSYYSKKSSVCNPSQTTPSIRDTQPSWPPHSENHPDNSDASLVHSSTTLPPAGHELMQDGSTAQTPLNTGMCEPDPIVMPQSGSRHTVNQCSVVTTQTISTVQYKETGATTQLCTETVVTNGPPNGTKANTQFGTETVAKIEPSEEYVVISEPDEETVTTTESSEETETTTEPLDKTTTNAQPEEEIALIIGTLKETAASTEPDEETLPISGTSEETTASTEPDEETLPISGTSEETAASTEPDEETLPISGTSEETTASTEPDEEPLPISGTSEETTASTEPDEEPLPISGTSEETTASTEPDEEPLPISETPETTATTELGEMTVNTPKSSEETVTTTEPPQEIFPTTGTLVETTTTTEPAEETVANTEPYEETAALKVTLQDTETTNEISEETAVTTKPADKTCALSRTSGKIVTSSGTSEKTASPVEPSEETVANTKFPDETAPLNRTSEKTAALSLTSKKMAVACGTSEKTAVTCQTSEKIAVTCGTSEKTAVICGMSGKTTVTCGTSVETALTCKTSEETAVICKTSEETAMTYKTSEDTGMTYGTPEETAVTCETPEETAVTCGTPEETAVTCKSPEETAVTCGTLEETAVTCGTLEETAVTCGTPEETAVTCGTPEETAVTCGTSEETTVTCGTSEETAVTCGTSEETAVTCGTPEETAVTCGTPEETAVTCGTLEETAVTCGTPEETAVTCKTPEETAVTCGTLEETAVTCGTPEETAVSCGTSEETAVTCKTSEETAVTCKTSEETAVTCGTSEKTAVLSRTLQETSVINRTSEDTSLSSGTSEETSVSSGTSEETSVSSGTAEETTVTCGTSKETSVISGTSEEAAVTYGTSEKTAVTNGSFEEVVVSGECGEDAIINTTEPTEESTATIKPIEETGTTSGTSEETSATSEHCEEIKTTSDPSEETVVANEPTKKTMVNAESSEEITGTPKPFKEPEASPEPLKGILTTHGDTKATCQPPRDTTVTTQETTAVHESLNERVATKDNCKRTVATNVHHKETATTTARLSTVARKLNTTTTCTHTTGYGMNAVVTTYTATSQTASSSPTNTLGTGGTANSTQVTSAAQEALATRSTICGRVKAEISKPHMIHHATTHIKTFDSSTILVPPPNKGSSGKPRQYSVIQVSQNETYSKKTFDSSDNSRQYSVIKVSQNETFSKKTSCQALDHESQAILKRTRESDHNATNLQQSALRKSPESLTEFEQKNEHHVNNLKHNGTSPGSKRTFTFNSKHVGTNNTPTKVRIVTLAEKEDNTPHQMETSVYQGKEKDGLQKLHKYKADRRLKKSLALLSKNSKDIKLIPDKKKLLPEAPTLVNSSKPSLHRSERVCIKVLSTGEKTLAHEGHKAENSIGSKKGNVWLYQDPCKERARTEKRVDTKSSHLSSPIHLGIHQEGRESNDNTEIPSPRSPRASSKGVVKLISIGHNQDKLKHTSKSEKYNLEDTNTCTVQRNNEKIPTSINKRHKNSCVERIPGSSDKFSTVSVKNAKNTCVENHCDKEKVEVSDSCVLEKDTDKASRMYHKPVTPKVEVHGKKKVHEKTPSKSLVLEENKQSRKGKFSSPATRPDRTMSKSSSDVTPSKQEAACRTPKGPPEKKQKLTFEELMNYDASIGHL